MFVSTRRKTENHHHHHYRFYEFLQGEFGMLSRRSGFSATAEVSCFYLCPIVKKLFCEFSIEQILVFVVM